MAVKKVTLKRAELAWALGGVIVAASKDDVTPVLTGVHWVIDDKWVTLTTSDRYRAHQTRLPRPKGANMGEFLMSGEQARWLLKTRHDLRGGLKEHELVVIEWDTRPVAAGPDAIDISVTVAANEGTNAARFQYQVEGIRGNFPPIARLFLDDATGPKGAPVEIAAYNPHYMADFTKLVKWRGNPLVHFTPRAAKAPLRVADSRGDDWNARGLLQPNLIVR